MAVGIRLKLEGVTAELMDKLNAAIDPDTNPPDGIIFHASGPVDGGWGVLYFWESRAHFDRFAEERIGPAMAAIGATAWAGWSLSRHRARAGEQPSAMAMRAA